MRAVRGEAAPAPPPEPRPEPAVRPLLLAGQVAEVLRVPKARVYEMARARAFPAGVVVRLGRQVRFDGEALREWIRRGGAGGE